MTNYRRGYEFEREIISSLKDSGASFVARTAGSHTLVDVIAIKGDTLFLIQAGRQKLKGTSTLSRKKRELEALCVPPVLRVVRQIMVRTDGSKEAEVWML